MTGSIYVLGPEYLRQVYDQASEGEMALTLEVDIAWPGVRDGRGFLKCFHNKRSIGLCNEVTGHILAQACDLPVPDYAALLKLPQAISNQLPEFSTWAFAVSRLPGTTAGTRYNLDDPAEIRALYHYLSNWNYLPAAIAFDDWTANQDRNMGNVLVDGPRRVFLIDHSNLPVTLNWKPDDLDPQKTYTNHLLDLFQRSGGSGAPELAGILLSASKHSPAYEAVEEDLIEWWSLMLSEAPDRRSALKNFLSSRANDGSERLSAHLNLLAV